MPEIKLKGKKEKATLWGFLEMLIKHPATMLLLGALIMAIIAFSTIQVTYVNGHWIWQKQSITKVIDAVKGTSREAYKLNRKEGTNK